MNFSVRDTNESWRPQRDASFTLYEFFARRVVVLAEKSRNFKKMDAFPKMRGNKCMKNAFCSYILISNVKISA